MSIEFYDISSKLGEVTWSPNTFKTRYTLNYKGLAYKHIFVEYPDIKSVCEKIGAAPTDKNPDGSPLYTFPVIRDLSTGAVVSDSAAITQYLEKQYPDKPTLIPSGTLALHNAFDDALKTKLGNLFPLLLPKVPGVLNPPSEEYFERTRKAKFGVPLSEVYPKDTDAQWKKVEADLKVVASWFKEGEFIGGDKPVYADINIASFIIWARVICGADSEAWKNLTSFQDGRWAKFIESLKQYE
ncbi:hypothetical protein PQX77_004787 [Marasmius sp. AFHP31]|nr:hypothetical protein PQX77_004787 [Marasmius sp. AFHP31]